MTRLPEFLIVLLCAALFTISIFLVSEGAQNWTPPNTQQHQDVSP